MIVDFRGAWVADSYLVGVECVKAEPKARRPISPGKDVQGDFAQFTDFMRRLVSVPHSEVKKRLEEEKRARKSKPSSSRVPASS
jgi:hypothetical protein